MVDEQPDRAWLVHHHVVASVGPAAVDVDVRHDRDAAGLLAYPQGGGDQQAVGPALLHQVPVAVGRLRVVGRLLHDHDDVAAVGGPLQRPPLQPCPDRVAQQRDHEREGAGALPLQPAGQRVGPVALLPGGIQDLLVDLGPDRLRRIAVEHAGHRGGVHADRPGDVDEPGRAAPAGLRAGGWPPRLRDGPGLGIGLRLTAALV
jgi:hypothetical protein